jgi:hypothetical protein
VDSSIPTVPDAGAAGDAREAGASSGDVAAPKPQRVVFVSSALYTGDLGGLAGADAKCQALASAAGLGGTFMAWLTLEDPGNTPARARLSHATVPYVLVDGTVVASDWAGLTSGTLLHAIDQTETGQAPSAAGTGCNTSLVPQGSAAVPVWTDTDSDGNFAAFFSDCAGWRTTTGSVAAIWGDATRTGPEWTNACEAALLANSMPNPCAATASLYCVQQ